MTLGGWSVGIAIQVGMSPRQAVETALRNREAIVAARATVEAARKGRRALGAYPAVRIESGFASNPDVNPGEDLGVFVPIDVFGRTRVALRQGSADVRAAQVAFRQVALDVQSETLQAYVELASAQRRERIGVETLILTQQIAKATSTLVDERRVPEIQKIRADLEVKRMTQEVIDRRAATRAASVRLQGALGLRESLRVVPNLEAFNDAMAAPVDMVRLRPDLDALRADVDRANADASAGRQSRLPNLEAQFHRAPWSTGTEAYGFRLFLTGALWDDGQAAATVRAAEFRRKAAQRTLDDKTRLAEREREAAGAEFDAAKRSALAYRELTEDARTVLAKVRRGYDLGAATLLDVIDARRTLSDTLESSIAAERRYDLAVEALLRVQGRLLVDVQP